MDKSVGTVLQFERFLTDGKFYPHGQCLNRQGTIPLILQHCIGWGRGGKMDL